MFTLKVSTVVLHGVAFSPDGHRLVACGARGAVRVWDLRDRRSTHRFSTGYAANKTAFFLSANDLFVQGVGRPKRIVLREDAWSVEPPSFGDRHFQGSCVSRDFRRLCLADRRRDGDDPNEKAPISLVQYRLPDLEQQWVGQRRVHDAGGRVVAMSYSADGHRVACGDGTGWVTVHETDGGKLLYGVRDGPTQCLKSVALSPTGDLVVWSVDSCLYQRRLSPQGELVRHSLGRAHVMAVAFHPSGDFFATASGDGKVDYWDAHTGEHRQAFDWGVGKLHGLTFDAAGDRAACCSQIGEVVVWDVDR